MSKYGPHALKTAHLRGGFTFRFRCNSRSRPKGFPVSTIIFQRLEPGPLTPEELELIKSRALDMYDELLQARGQTIQGQARKSMPEGPWKTLCETLMDSFWFERCCHASKLKFRGHFNAIANDFYGRAELDPSRITQALMERWLRTRGFKPWTILSYQCTFNRLMEAAKQEGLRDTYTPIRFKITRPEQRRLRVWTPQDVQVITKLFDDQGDTQIAELILVGYESGQRMGDVRQLRFGHDYRDGELFYKANKTGQLIMLKLPPYLTERLQARYQEGELMFRSALGKPLTCSHLPEYFRAVVQRHSDYQDSFPKLRHLRHTAVINFARAGCTVPQIASVTRHSLASVHRILALYLPHDPVLAEQAMAMRASMALSMLSAPIMVDGAERLFIGAMPTPQKPTADLRKQFA